MGCPVQAAAADKGNAELQQAVTQQVEALKKAKTDLQKAEKQQQERWAEDGLSDTSSFCAPYSQPDIALCPLVCI